MKLMLTSFGIVDDASLSVDDASLFYRMPPVSMEIVSKAFIPDYEALLLSERILFDESSFGRLTERPDPSYVIVSETIKALHSEGFIELVNFEKILDNNKDLLRKMLEHDLKTLDQWIEPLKNSLDIWQGFSRLSRRLTKRASGINFEGALRSIMEDVPGLFNFTHHHLDSVPDMLRDALSSSRKRRTKQYRAVLRRVLGLYLSYVNANLVLSDELGVGFHDWNDFLPFYRHKFLSIGRKEIEPDQSIRESHKLFEITFPEFTITNPSMLIKVMQDKRIASLRQLVQDAVEGKVVFDEGFAKSVLTEVLSVERRTRRYRNITSYLTMPVGFIPWIGTPAQKLLEEAIGTPLEKKLKKKHQWFYLLSELSDGHEVNKVSE